MFFEYLCSSLINLGVCFYALFKILDFKPNFSNLKIYSVYIVWVILGTLSATFLDFYFRSVLMCLYMIFICLSYFKLNLKKSLISTLMLQFILFASEILFVLFVVTFLNISADTIMSDFIGYIFGNLIISFFMMILVQVKFIKEFHNYLCYITNKMTIKTCLKFLSIGMISSYIILANVYLQLSVYQMYFINVVFVILFSLIMLKSMTEHSDNLNYKSENSLLSSNLGEYEKMLDHNRQLNHETKNQLVVIKGMIKNNDINVFNYIDEIVNEYNGENDVLLNAVKRIPLGGLQGLLYQKLIVMNDCNIKTNVEIQKNMNRKLFENLDSKDTFDLCRMMGVFLDNAIDESKMTEKKEVNVYIYVEDNEIFIEISNYYVVVPDLKKLGSKRYTTKSEGHGFGLSIVEKILDENKIFKNEKLISGKTFVQRLKIKKQHID